jgi:hypothetical protein
MFREYQKNLERKTRLAEIRMRARGTNVYQRLIDHADRSRAGYVSLSFVIFFTLARWVLYLSIATALNVVPLILLESVLILSIPTWFLNILDYWNPKIFKEEVNLSSYEHEKKVWDMHFQNA